jgi:hypothetical protein
MLQAELHRQLANADSLALHAPTAPAGLAVYPSYSSPATAEAPGAQLLWMESLPGDLDLNGEVNSADLIPLARYFGDDFAAFDAATTFTATDTQTWFARLDVDGNGIIGLSDLVGIARHFHEHLDGYRVYRRNLGAAGWMLLPNTAIPGSPMTLTHVQVAAANWGGDTPTKVPQYSLLDTSVPPADVEYKVVPYFRNGQLEGAASLPIAIRVYPDSTAVFYLDCSLNNVYVSSEPVFCTISASASSDRLPLQVAFDFGANGSYEVSRTFTGQTNPLRFDLIPYPAGTYPLRVRAVDNSGITVFQTLWLTVRDGNQAPTVSGSLILPDSAAPARVDATYTADDPDGDYYDVKYLLQRPGGALETVSLPQKLYAAGAYTLVITATDPFGASGSWQQDFSLTAQGPRSGGWEFPKTFRQSLQGDLATIAGRPAVIFRGQTDLSYEHTWSYLRSGDDLGLSWPADSEAGWLPSEDSSGKPAFDASLHDVNGRAAALMLTYAPLFAYNAYSVALDDTGSTWSPAMEMPFGSNYIGGEGGLAVIDGRPSIAAPGQGNELCIIRALDEYGLTWPDAVQPIPNSYAVVATQLTQVNGMATILAMGASKIPPIAMWLAQDEDATSFGTVVPVSTTLNIGNYGFMLPGEGPLTLAVSDGSRPALISAQDDQASSWSSPADLPLSSNNNEYSLALIGGKPAMAYYDPVGMQLMYTAATDASAIAWSDPVVIDGQGDCGSYAKLNEVAGRPAVLYYAATSWDSSGKVLGDSYEVRYAVRSN